MTLSLTKLIVEAIVVTRAVGGTALRDGGLSKALRRHSNDAHDGREGDKTGGKGDHGEDIVRVSVDAIYRVEKLYLFETKDWNSV